MNLVLGVAGLGLPFLQGILHLLVAAMLMAPDFRPARKLSLGMYRRWPRVRRLIPKWLRRLSRGK